MLGELHFQTRAAGPTDNQIVVGGFGRTHRQLGPGRSCLLLPKMVWAKCHFQVPLFTSPHQENGWKGFRAGPASNRHLGGEGRVLRVGQAEVEQFHSGKIHLGSQARNSQEPFNLR